MRIHRIRLAAAVGLAVAASQANAQIITTLVREGDAIPGVGNVALLSGYAVNNSGQWIVDVDTDNPDTNADSAILHTGTVFWRENDAFAGLAVSSWDDHSLNNAGEYGGNLFLRPTGTGDSSVHINKNVVLQEGTISGSPAFTAPTPYIGFFGAKIKDGRVGLVVASVDDPAIPTTVDRALVRFTTGATGGFMSETVLAKEGDLLPGAGAPVADFETDSNEFGLSNTGVAIFGATLTGTTNNNAVYTHNGTTATLLAIEGGSSPAAGRNWANLASAKVSISGNGLHTSHTGTLDGDTATDSVIVRDGAIFKQEGDSVNTIDGLFALTSFGTVGSFVDDAGNIVWFGDWNNPDTTRDTGIFFNDLLLVQEGVTLIDGLVVQTLRSVADTLVVSDNGQFILFEADLAGGIEGAFLIAVPIPEPSSLALVGLAAAGIVARRFRRKAV